MPDWFRRKTWTDNDRHEFMARLDRSRGGFHKAQYARIQAFELAEVGTEPCVRGAIELLNLVLHQYPEPLELAAVYSQMGQCHQFFGDVQSAVNCYRKALEQQRALPVVITTAHLDYGLLVAELALEGEYDEALKSLDEFGSTDPFPLGRFRSCVIRALIARHKGQREKAKEWAKLALDEASRTHSGMRHHPRLGLVGADDRDRVHRMRSLIQD